MNNNEQIQKLINQPIKLSKMRVNKYYEGTNDKNADLKFEYKDNFNNSTISIFQWIFISHPSTKRNFIIGFFEMIFKDQDKGSRIILTICFVVIFISTYCLIYLVFFK